MTKENISYVPSKPKTICFISNLLKLSMLGGAISFAASLITLVIYRKFTMPLYIITMEIALMYGVIGITALVSSYFVDDDWTMIPKDYITSYNRKILLLNHSKLSIFNYRFKLKVLFRIIAYIFGILNIIFIIYWMIT